MPGRNLNLLSLDGGGVRGLSALYILQRIMVEINPDDPPKPCEYFDLIGGTSTGGLIAIMLGRLQMTVDDCISAYTELSKSAFKREHRIPASLNGNIRARYSSASLEDAIKKVMSDRGLPEDALLKESSSTNVFVCCTSGATSETVLLRSYYSVRAASNLYNNVKIWEAARATSAASTFFDSLMIGNQRFLDGGSGANNPVQHVWNEAIDMVRPESVANNLNCLLSIGTGEPSYSSFNETIKGVVDALKTIATETEKTAEYFRREHFDLFGSKVCFRFTVSRGMGDIGMAEEDQLGAIEAMTDQYLQSETTSSQIIGCVATLKQGQLISHQRDIMGQALRAEEQNLMLVSQRPEWQLEQDERDGFNILEVLSDYNPVRKNFNVSSKRLDGTTGWILKHERFQEWLTSPTQRCLWLCGIIGSGKTVLASAVIHRLQQLYSSTREKPGNRHESRIGPVLHFYFDENERKHLTADGLFRSLTKQLLAYQPAGSHRTMARIRELYGLRAAPTNHEETVSIVLIPLLRLFKNSYLVIDGLNECNHTESTNVLESLNLILQVLGCSLKVFISGRDELNVSERIPGTCLVWMRPSHTKDSIEIYTRHEIDRSTRMYRRISDNPETIDLIERTLVEKAQGMFLWIRLQIEMLWDVCFTDSAIIDTLSNLPKDLDTTYARCVQRLDKRKELYSLRVLRYVCEAVSPLPVRALAEALTIDSDTGRLGTDVLADRFIIECGANLIFLDELEQVVLPAHHSVRKFLSCSKARVLTDLELHIWNDAEARLAELCILHLHWHRFGGITMQTKDVPIQLSRLSRWIPSVKPSVWMKPFLYKPKTATRQVSGDPRTIRLPPRVNWRHQGFLFRYAREHWLSQAGNINDRRSTWEQFKAIVLDPSDVLYIAPWSHDDEEPNHRMPYHALLDEILGWAVCNDHLPLLEIGIEAVYDSEISILEYLNRPLSRYGQLTPLHLASRNGYDRIVSRLVSFCDPETACTPKRRTALHYAVDGGHAATTEALLNQTRQFHSKILQIKDCDEMTPIDIAVRKGKICILQILHNHFGLTIYDISHADLAFHYKHTQLANHIISANIIRYFPQAAQREYFMCQPISDWVLRLRRLGGQWKVSEDVSLRCLKTAIRLKSFDMVDILFILRGLPGISGTAWSLADRYKEAPDEDWYIVTSNSRAIEKWGSQMMEFAMEADWISALDFLEKAQEYISAQETVRHPFPEQSAKFQIHAENASWIGIVLETERTCFSGVRERGRSDLVTRVETNDTLAFIGSLGRRYTKVFAQGRCLQLEVEIVSPSYLDSVLVSFSLMIGWRETVFPRTCSLIHEANKTDIPVSKVKNRFLMTNQTFEEIPVIGY